MHVRCGLSRWFTEDRLLGDSVRALKRHYWISDQPQKTLGFSLKLTVMGLETPAVVDDCPTYLFREIQMLPVISPSPITILSFATSISSIPELTFRKFSRAL